MYGHHVHGLIATSCLFALCLGATAHGAVLVEVAAESGADMSATRQLMETALRDLGETVLAGDDVRARWSAHTAAVPHPEHDATFMADVEANVHARNLYFDNHFGEAAELLETSLTHLERDPSVLSFHPDLVTATFEAMLTLARCYEAMGRTDDASTALQRVASLMWFADVEGTAFPPDFVERYTAQQERMPTRSVRLEWRGDEGCRAFINGYAVGGVTAGHTMRLPAGPQFVRLQCRNTRSLVHRIRENATALQISLHFDDAVIVSSAGLRLDPRRGRGGNLRRLARDVATAIDQPVVYMISEVVPGTKSRAQIVELSRTEHGAETPYRAARVRVEAPSTSARILTAASYLVSGRAEADLRVWDAEHGWDSAAAPVGRRSPIPWAFGGAAVAAATTAIVLETRVRDAVRDIDACADGLRDATCSGDTLRGYRGDAQRQRAVSNIMWTVGALSATTAIVSAIRHRPRPDTEWAWVPERGGGRVAVFWRF